MKVKIIYVILPSDQSIASRGVKRYTMVTASIDIDGKKLVAKFVTYNRKQADQLWEILDERLIKKFVCGMAHLKETFFYEQKKIFRIT